MSPGKNVLLAILAAAAALVACGDDDGATPTPADGSDEDVAGEYTGPAKTGLIQLPDGGGGDPQPATDLGDAGLEPFDAGPACCTLAFSIADGTNDEPTARLRGDFGPLAGEGVPLAWTNGRWTAEACIPTRSFVRYRYYFGQVRENPVEDAGALVADDRVDDVNPAEDDGNGALVNTLTLGASCVQ